MQEIHQSNGQTPSASWSYTRSTFPTLSSPDADVLRYRAQVFEHFGDDEEVMARLKHDVLPPATSPSRSEPGVYQMWQGAVAVESPSTQNDEVHLRTKIGDLLVALKASERARREGEHETEALRTYLTEVEVAAAGLVSRVQELEQHITLLTASRENLDVEQLRSEMLIMSAKEAHERRIAASQAISAARQVTMDLDKLKREASALTACQEEEIRRLTAQASHYRMLYEGQVAQIEEMKRDEEKLINQTGEAEAALVDSRNETAALRRGIEILKKEAEINQAQVHDLVKTLKFAKAAARAAERQLQEARVEKKDISIQNELLQNEVADLQNRDVQATISHYDHELCKVRAVLEGEKAHLFAELARYRRGNRNLKGDLAEWRGKYNLMRSRRNGASEEASAAECDPTEFSSLQLKDFFKMDTVDKPVECRKLHVLPDHTESRMNDTSKSVRASRSESAENRDGQSCRSNKKEDRAVCTCKGRDSLDKESSITEKNELDDAQRSIDVRRQREVSEGREQKCSPRNPENSGAQTSASPRRLWSDGEVLKPERARKQQLQIKTVNMCESVENQQPSTVLKVDSQEAKGVMRNSPQAVESQNRTSCEEDPCNSSPEDICLETGENLLAVAHREICRLKQENRGERGHLPFAASLKLFGPIIFFLLRVVTRQASQKRAGPVWETSQRTRVEDILFEGLRFLEMRLD